MRQGRWCILQHSSTDVPTLWKRFGLFDSRCANKIQFHRTFFFIPLVRLCFSTAHEISARTFHYFLLFLFFSPYLIFSTYVLILNSLSIVELQWIGTVVDEIVKKSNKKQIKKTRSFYALTVKFMIVFPVKTL